MQAYAKDFTLLARFKNYNSQFSKMLTKFNLLKSTTII